MCARVDCTSRFLSLCFSVSLILCLFSELRG